MDSPPYTLSTPLTAGVGSFAVSCSLSFGRLFLGVKGTSLIGNTAYTVDACFVAGDFGDETFHLLDLVTEPDGLMVRRHIAASLEVAVNLPPPNPLAQELLGLLGRWQEALGVMGSDGLEWPEQEELLRNQRAINAAILRLSSPY